MFALIVYTPVKVVEHHQQKQGDIYHEKHT